MTIPYPIPSMPIVRNDGTMEEPFRIFTLQVSKLGFFIGTGTPEGVVEAEQTQVYMDDTGTAGNILYVKRDADIAGDKTKGWILI